jgi:hypothetical protein
MQSPFKKNKQNKSAFANFEMVQDETIERILGALLKPDSIELKTEIAQPLNLARLSEFGNFMFSLGYKECEKTIKSFVKYYLEYMVSHDRQGRKEIIQALAQSLKAEQSTLEKMSQPP